MKTVGPDDVITNHGIEHRDHLAHGRNDHDLVQLPAACPPLPTWGVAANRLLSRVHPGRAPSMTVMTAREPEADQVVHRALFLPLPYGYTAAFGLKSRGLAPPRGAGQESNISQARARHSPGGLRVLGARGHPQDLLEPRQRSV